MYDIAWAAETEGAARLELFEALNIRSMPDVLGKEVEELSKLMDTSSIWRGSDTEQTTLARQNNGS